MTQSCPTLCDPMDCNMSGLPVHPQLLKLAQTHVHRVGEAIQPSQFSATPFSFGFQSFPATGSFPVSWLFASGGQTTGTSDSASVLPMNIRGSFPLGLTGLISLQCKGDSCLENPMNSMKRQKSSLRSHGANSRVGITLPTVSLLPPAPHPQELFLLSRLLGKVNWGEEIKCKMQVIQFESFNLVPAQGKKGEQTSDLRSGR